MRGTSVLTLTEDNAYTMATFADQGASDYGSFSAVYLNDAAVDLETWDYELAYNSGSIQLIPEPGTLALLLLAGGALLLRRRRR